MNVTVNGDSVFYGTGGGQAAGTTLVFIHGAAMDHTVWTLPARYFARHGYRVVALDLPGHGQSEGAPLTSIAAMRDWTIALLDALETDEATLVGHSMGSLISFATAASAPDRISRIALLGTSAPMPVSAGLLDAAQDNHHAAIEMANTWSHSPAGALGSSGHPGQCNLNAGMRLMERSAPGVLHADLAACNGFVAADYGRISTTPALVIAGTADQMTPLRAGLKVAESIPDCTLQTLDGCGHSMLSEQPNEVLDALAAFLP